ncbi:MAG: sigma-70 family RNA polymerase sigma factor [Candidatus Thiodiazotropha sp.]
MNDLTAAWDSHRERVGKYLRRRLASEADVEDLQQETFLRLYRAQPSLADSSRIEAWLLHTARNLLVDHYRASRPTSPLEVEPAAQPNRVPTPLETLQPCISPLLTRLPEKYRQALSLDLDGVPQQEIAQRQGVGLSGAKSRVQRARNLLHREFERCCMFSHDDDGTLLDYRQRLAGNSCA